MKLEKLSKTEKKILASAAETGQKQLTIDTIAAKAGCSPVLVAKKLQVPEFRQLFVEAIKSSLVGETPAILHTFVSAAKEGSFKHGKLILEMTGVHQDKQKVEMSGQVEINDTLFKTDEERISFLKETVGEFIKNSRSAEEE